MSIISTISPKWALQREIYRGKLAFIRNQGYGDHGASSTKKSLLSLNVRAGSPDEDIVINAEKLRARSRSLYMGVPLARGGVDTVKINVAGAGLILNAQIDSEFLGVTPEDAQTWEENTEREWSLFCRTCDAERRLDFGQLCGLAELSSLVSGDVLALLPYIRRPESVYDLKIRLVESDRLSDPLSRDYDKDILGGVEVDENGAVVAYHICSNHPRSTLFNRKKLVSTWTRILAYGELSGRRNVLHLMNDIERPGQRRGVPILAPVIEALKQLGDYTHAELMAAVINGYFALAITQDLPEIGAGSLSAGDKIDSDPNVTEIPSGTIAHLAPGEKVDAINPGRPNVAFDGFVQSICRQIGAALGIGHELLVKHFTASYSASRGALLEAWKVFSQRRTRLINGFCQPIYEEWLTEAVLRGRIVAPGFFADPAIKAAWCAAEWCGPTMGQLNPVQEVTAAKIRVEEEFSTREREAGELTGGNWDRIHRTRTREEARRREDKTAPSVPGVLPVAPDKPSKEDDE